MKGMKKKSDHHENFFHLHQTTWHESRTWVKGGKRCVSLYLIILIFERAKTSLLFVLMCTTNKLFSSCADVHLETTERVKYKKQFVQRHGEKEKQSFCVPFGDYWMDDDDNDVFCVRWSRLWKGLLGGSMQTKDQGAENSFVLPNKLSRKRTRTKKPVRLGLLVVQFAVSRL